MTDVADLRVGDERVVDVGPIAHGGHCIAHTDGRTLFVRHTLPGERVRIRVTDVNRRMVRADAIEVLTASVDRVPAPCPWAHPEGCGGCDFQHVDVAAQRRLKQTVLTEALGRFGHLDADALAGLDLTVHELPGHPDGLHWRTRMSWATDAAGHVGLRRHRRHDVVPVDRCLIAAAGVDLPGAVPGGKVTHTVRHRSWRLAASDFWQVHDALPEALVDAVLTFGAPRPGETWWDLYAGAGLFSAFLGEAVGPTGAVAAVESSDEGLRAARRALHDLHSVRLHLADVRDWLVTASGPVDGVVLDPPRAGAGRAVVDAICAARPQRVVYVACDPVALARDIAVFAGNGYRLRTVTSFDAFPMTHHQEAVAWLEARDS